MASLKYDLEAEIRLYPEVIAKFADRDFCMDFWGAFANITWYKKFDPQDTVEEQVVDILQADSEDRWWHASFRYMGGFIADIRNQYHNANEDYMTWYCTAQYGLVPEHIKETMALMGWFPVEDDYYRAANK